MAQKPNKKQYQGKPVYKPRQQPAAQASAPATTEASSTATAATAPSQKKGGEQVNWHAVMNNAQKQSEQTKKSTAAPVDFQQIHAGGAPPTSTAFQSTSTAAESGTDAHSSQPNKEHFNSNREGGNNTRSYQPKGYGHQQRNNNNSRQYGGGQGGNQGNQKGGHGHGHGGQGGHSNYNSNSNRSGQGHSRQGSYQNFQANPQAMIGGMTPQMLANQPQLLTHGQNLQQMEVGEMESLLHQLCSQIDPELLQQTFQQAGVQGIPGMPFPGGRPGGPQSQGGQRGHPKGKNQYQGNQNYQSRPESGYGSQGRGKKYQAHGNQRSQQPHSMPMPGGGKAAFQKMDSADFPAFGAQGASAVQGNQQKLVYQAKKAAPKDGDLASGAPDQSSQAQGGGSKQGRGMGGMPFFTNAVQMNLCQVHFPEPIMMFKEKPLCKKCIQEEFAQQQAQFRKMSHTQHAMSNAKLLGLQHRPMLEFQSEKQKITRSLHRLDNFKKSFRYIEDDIKQREQMSAEHMRILTPLMNSMFDKLEELQMQGEEKFKNKIFQIVRNQQRLIQDDINSKLPQFYKRLGQKYSELQQATNLAQQRGADELIETLKHFETIFIELDAEYEKYFNDYEKMSKLQRLLDKDANEIVRDFTDVVERNLRMDYNIKSSFGPQLPQRLHSFQWNQKCVQLYRLKSGLFEKKPVQMTYDVPLYSRSIATETGTIYLTGGYVKHMGVYLKNCYRYDDLFGILNPVSHMNYPHADHSICTIQNFIYVIGTFVGNQVYGYCEVYDTQKDKWKLIADMRVPRSGTSLCVFKNNYIFAFGGRVDQKRIVDTIEVYDISRNVWQEVAAPRVDKSTWVPSYMGLAHQITDNEILLFGGKSAATFHIFNGCFVFDVEKMEIRERGSLVNPCSFMNTPLVFNHCLFAYGNDIYVHQYSIPEQKWSVIPKSSVVLPKA